MYDFSQKQVEYLLHFCLIDVFSMLEPLYVKNNARKTNMKER